MQCAGETTIIFKVHSKEKRGEKRLQSVDFRTSGGEGGEKAASVQLFTLQLFFTV